ncbi:MAG: hypothetical protein NW226_05445 [Microscillaceae bacterium]|nr:hypothetical protein [Microscillaceae bacterium]
MAKTQEKDFTLIEEAYVALLALDERHLKIIEQKFIEDEKKPLEWTEFLHGLAHYDKIRDLAVEQLGKGIWRNLGRRISLWGIFATGLFFFISLIFEIPIPAWIFMGAIGFFILAGLIYRYSPQGQKYAVLNRKLKQTEQSDFPNIIRNYLLPLLNFLKEECQTETTIKLLMNFSPRKFQKGSDTLRPNYTTPTGYVHKDTEYAQYDVLRLSTRLSDGSTLIYHLKDMSRRRNFSRTKRSASGKYKTKYKTKYKVKISHTLKLVVSKKQYRLRPVGLPATSTGIRMDQIENDKKYIFKLRGVNFLRAQLGTNHLPDMQALLNLIGEVYKRLEKVEQNT